MEGYWSRFIKKVCLFPSFNQPLQWPKNLASISASFFHWQGRGNSTGRITVPSPKDFSIFYNFDISTLLRSMFLRPAAIKFVLSRMVEFRSIILSECPNILA